MIQTRTELEISQHSAWVLYAPEPGDIDRVSILTDPRRMDICYRPGIGYYRRTPETLHWNQPWQDPASFGQPYDHWAMLIAVWPTDKKGFILRDRILLSNTHLTPKVQVWIMPHWQYQNISGHWDDWPIQDHDAALHCDSTHPWPYHLYSPRRTNLMRQMPRNIVAQVDHEVRHWSRYDPHDLIPDWDDASHMARTQ